VSYSINPIAHLIFRLKQESQDTSNSKTSAKCPGTRSRPFEIIKSDEEGSITIPTLQKVLTCAKKHCSGVYLEMPVGVLPYVAYPFMLHDVYTLPWDLHIIEYRLFIQSTHCTKSIQHINSDCCHKCKRLLTHRTVEGILHRISAGIHINQPTCTSQLEGSLKSFEKKTKRLMKCGSNSLQCHIPLQHERELLANTSNLSWP
jgi:hypothetical protein